MDVHAGHRDRLKERFLKHGLDTFEPHSLLELLLFFAIPRRDTNVLGHRLLSHFGSISGVFDAPYHELIKVEGIGHNAAVLIKMIPDLARVYLDDKYSDTGLLNSTTKLGEFLKHKFVGRTNEMVLLLCLDHKCKLLHQEIISEGSLDTVPILPRRLIEPAVRVGAASVVLAHNHPQGFAIPSKKDVETTRRLAQGLDGIGICLLDHFIVARDEYVSMADLGVIRPRREGEPTGLLSE